MSKMALILGAILITSSVGMIQKPKENETIVAKGYHESDRSIARDPENGLPLVNPPKGPSPKDGAPRGDKL